MLLLVVRCLAFVVVQAETMARGNASVNAGRSVVRAVVQALILEHGLLYVLQAEPKQLSNRLRGESFAFRPSARFMFG